MLLIFGVGCFLEPLPARPEGAHSTTTFLRRMATDLALAGRFEVAARDRKIGLAGAEQRDALAGAVGRDRRQPDRTAFARESLRHQLDQFLIVAAGGPTAIRSVVGRST